MHGPLRDLILISLGKCQADKSSYIDRLMVGSFQTSALGRVEAQPQTPTFIVGVNFKRE